MYILARVDANPLAGEHGGHQHNSPVDTGQAFAAVNPLVDLNIVYDRNFPQSHMKRVLSGIQPTGSPHIGNYLGALKNWAKIQYDYDSIYCIVDLHAVTLYQEPKELRQKIEELAGMLLAIGIDPTHSSLVVQSAIPQHAELAWMLTCVTPVGWLERMTQYKAKAAAQIEEARGSLKGLANLQPIGSGLLQY